MMRIFKKAISIHWTLKKFVLATYLITILSSNSVLIIFFLLILQSKNAEYRTAPASVQAFFAKISGEDMEVDAGELQQILNYALKKGRHLTDRNIILSFLFRTLIFNLFLFFLF